MNFDGWSGYVFKNRKPIPLNPSIYHQFLKHYGRNGVSIRFYGDKTIIDKQNTPVWFDESQDYYVAELKSAITKLIKKVIDDNQ